MLTLPNLLTMSRIFAVPLLVVMMWGNGWIGFLLAFILFCIAGVTDFFDGYLARARGTVSKLGVFLDPIADKIMVAAVIIMLIFADILHGVHILAGLIILLREITVSGLREFLAGLQVSVPVSRLAKWKTTAQMVALGALILAGVTRQVLTWIPAYEVGLICLWAAALLTLVTGWTYLRSSLRYMS